MDESRLKQLERERDYAINQARILRARLEPPPASRPAPQSVKKQRLHAILDRIQSLTPGFLRALVRGFYLKYFYYRVYPEHAPRAAQPVWQSPINPLIAYSGYPPLLEFKRELTRDLHLDFRGISIPCERGLVSIVLPVYNGERFVEEAIKSALAQTYRSFELIIVDDGSADGTPEILKRYADRGNVRVIHQANRKLPAALNAGFEAARGEFFTWISDDNRMHPEMLATLVGFLQEHTGVEMVYGDEQLIDEYGNPALGADFCPHHQSPPGSNILRRPRDPGELNFVQDNFVGGCFLYRGWAGRILGIYSERCFGFEDYDYWMRMNALFRVAHLGTSDILHSYRLHPGSLTARDKELLIADRARYFTIVEAERRKLFTGGFDITFVGRHPWFKILASAYRRSGHNVLECPEFTAEAAYRYEVTRAFPKSIMIGDGESDGEYFAGLRDNRLTAAGFELTAIDAGTLEYPLLALANSVLWTRKECSGSR